MIKIEGGKYYRARNGGIYGPMRRIASVGYATYPFTDAASEADICSERVWTEKGEWHRKIDTSFDLIEEFQFEGLRSGDESLTRRDHFAMAALQGLLATDSRIKGHSDRTSLADIAYEYADLMESARKGRSP